MIKLERSSNNTRFAVLADEKLLVFTEVMIKVQYKSLLSGRNLDNNFESTDTGMVIKQLVATWRSLFRDPILLFT